MAVGVKRLVAARCIVVVGSAASVSLGALVLKAGLDDESANFEGGGITDMGDGHIQPYLLLRGVQPKTQLQP